MQHSRSSRALAFARARRAHRNWSDPYRPQGKPHPAVCRRCGATEWQGRWRWDGPIPDLPQVLCPACERIRDGAAAHAVELTGALSPWWNEVRGMIGGVESREVHEHPMERVLGVDVGDDRVRIATTGVHIARQLVVAFVRRFRHGVRLSFRDGVTNVDWLEPRRRV